MRIVVVLTSSQDRTADYVCRQLSGGMGKIYRLNTDTIDTRNAVRYRSGEALIRINTDWLAPGDVDVVWFRRPKPVQLSFNPVDDPYEQDLIEREWTEALDSWFAQIEEGCWINHPSENSEASHKIEQHKRAAEVGLSVPKTILTNKPKELEDFWNDCEGEIIAKPLTIGYVERGNQNNDTIIYTSKVTEKDIQSKENLDRCPTLFQEHIDKKLDVRVTVIDEYIHTIGLSSKKLGYQKLDIRRNEMYGVDHFPLDIPNDVEEKIKQMMNCYGLRYAAWDFGISEEGEWFFFELNPNGQWAWMDTEEEINIIDSFKKVFMGK